MCVCVQMEERSDAASAQKDRWPLSIVDTLRFCRQTTHSSGGVIGARSLDVGCATADCIPLFALPTQATHNARKGAKPRPWSRRVVWGPMHPHKCPCVCVCVNSQRERHSVSSKGSLRPVHAQRARLGTLPVDLRFCRQTADHAGRGEVGICRVTNNSPLRTATEGQFIMTGAQPSQPLRHACVRACVQVFLVLSLTR